MRRRTKIDKCIDLLEEIINDQYFHPALMANMIITTYPPATQARLVELMKYIYTYNKSELELDKKSKTGAYRNNNEPIKDRPDTSWIHEEFHGESANMVAQRASLF